jgi:hypothetical protein
MPGALCFGVAAVPGMLCPVLVPGLSAGLLSSQLSLPRPLPNAASSPFLNATVTLPPRLSELRMPTCLTEVDCFTRQELQPGRDRTCILLAAVDAVGR